MATITIIRGSTTAIPFSITDAGNSLLGKRVTWAVAKNNGGLVQLRKASDLPGSTSDVTITTQNAQQITGTINMSATDFAALPSDAYLATLWIDDGANVSRCVTAAGQDALVIQQAVPRA